MARLSKPISNPDSYRAALFYHLRCSRLLRLATSSVLVFVMMPQTDAAGFAGEVMTPGNRWSAIPSPRAIARREDGKTDLESDSHNSTFVCTAAPPFGIKTKLT